MDGLVTWLLLTNQSVLFDCSVVSYPILKIVYDIGCLVKGQI